MDENILIEPEKQEPPASPQGEPQEDASLGAGEQQQEKRKPDPYQKLGRLEREMKDLKEKLKFEQDKMTYMETELWKARNTPATPQVPVAQQYQLPQAQDDFVQRQHLQPFMETIDQRVARVEQNVNLTREQQFKQMANIIDADGNQRFEDYGNVVGAYTARWINPQIRAMEEPLVFGNPDPAGYIYRLAGGGKQDRKNARPLNRAAENQTISEEQDEPATIAGNRTASSDSGGGLTFESYVQAGEDVKRKIRAKLGDEGITKLRLDYYKRNKIPHGG